MQTSFNPGLVFLRKAEVLQFLPHEFLIDELADLLFPGAGAGAFVIKNDRVQAAREIEISFGDRAPVHRHKQTIDLASKYKNKIGKKLKSKTHNRDGDRAASESE